MRRRVWVGPVIPAPQQALLSGLEVQPGLESQERAEGSEGPQEPQEVQQLGFQEA